jgi:hypothetical protein
MREPASRDQHQIEKAAMLTVLAVNTAKIQRSETITKTFL